MQDSTMLLLRTHRIVAARAGRSAGWSLSTLRKRRASTTLSVLALTAALIAGCATRAPEGPPPLTTLPDVAPNFVVPSPRDRMIYLATQEWSLFGSGLVAYDGGGEPQVAFAGATAHEVQPAMLSRVLMYWYGVSRAPIVGAQGELRPWSAAFITWLARSAGFTREQFPDTVLHWDYIERFLSGGGNSTFVALDPDRQPPRTGDLVCNARGMTVTFATLRRGHYHCELVVAAKPGAVETIGGNVGDVVALSRFPVDMLGRLLPLPDRPWVAVLQYRGP